MDKENFKEVREQLVKSFPDLEVNLAVMIDGGDRYAFSVITPVTIDKINEIYEQFPDVRFLFSEIVE